jgi:hypothetical protein
VINIGTLGGNISAINANSAAWVFAGPTQSVVITSTTQKLVVWGTAPLGSTVAGNTTFRIDACYQLGAGAITNFTAFNWMQVSPNFTANERSQFTFNATVTGLTPGTYTVGCGVYNNGALALNTNDWLNLVYMVVN